MLLPLEPRMLKWFNYGLRDLERFLAKHAAFDEWCDEHPDPEPVEEVKPWTNST